MEYTKDLSIVISLFNEDESLPELIKWIEKVVSEERYTYEIIMVDDGSTDSSWKVIKELSENNPSQLRKVSSPLRGFQGSGRPCGHYHGCRPSGLS